MRTTLVMKFGGAAFATPESFQIIARIIQNFLKRYDKIVVVVSAMKNFTDEMITLTKKVHSSPPKRELDMLISIGERMSMSLLAMSLDQIGISAQSFTGSQSGIITDNTHTEARILDVRPSRIIECLSDNRVAICAGFQGMSRDREITTLGRGGSDTTAVALGVALDAKEVYFFKDVEGVFPEDPKLKPSQAAFSCLNYNDALAIVRRGAKILHSRCLELARANGVSLFVTSFMDSGVEKGTWIKECKERSKVKVYENGEGETTHGSFRKEKCNNQTILKESPLRN